MNFLKGSLFRRNTEPEELEPMEESGGGILAVWGSPGCGKTVTAVKIAKHLAAQKKNTVLLLCDMTAPMMPCICPPSELEVDKSLGSIFAAQHISVNLIKHNLTTLKRLPHLTMLGLRKKENEYTYRAAKAVLQDIYALDAEHTEAVKALEQLWEEGYTVAAHQLGKFYRDDLSTLRDHEKAEQWFRCSAEAGNDFSEYALGKLLLTQKRTVEALEWLDKAAEQGNQFARYRLGKIYLTGESVPKDVEKALAYLTASADQGNQFAQYALGKLYLFGRDVPPDREQAREWLIRAAAQGNEYARFFLDRFDQFRDPSVMLAATKLLHHMSRIFQSNSVPPSNPAGLRIDSKRRRRLMEKRMAMGHKADDHEEQTQYQQSM